MEEMVLRRKSRTSWFT